MNVRSLLIPGLVAVLLPVWGCDDEPGPEPQQTYTAVLVQDAVTTDPISNLDLLLYDIDRGRAAAPPVTTDEFGSAEIDGPLDSRCVWFVLPGQGWVPSSLPEPALIFTRGAVNPAVVSVLGVLSASPSGGFIVSGMVVDDVTDEPLAGVVVGYPGWPTAWDGLDETSSDVTGADGVFVASDVLFALEPGGDVPYQVLPLVYLAEGYRPRSLRFDGPGDDYVIRLTPISGDGGGVGAVGGRVVSREGPISGLSVVGTWINDGQKSWLTHPGVVIETDAEGRFLLTDLAPGQWLVKPGYLPTDGWTLIPGEAGHGGRLPAVVAAGDTVEVGDLMCLPAIVPRYPPPGAVGVDSLAVFRWTAVADVDSYDVFIGRWWLGRTATDSLAVPVEFPLEQGTWTWYMNASTAAGELVGLSETRYRFVVGPFPD